MGDLDFITDPIEDAIDAVGDVFEGAWDIATGWLNPDIDIPSITFPGPTAQEEELLGLNLQLLNRQLDMMSEESPLEIKQREYFEQLSADQVLSPEEEAMFEKEYSLNVEALQEQFGIETERLGGRQMADLLGRGVYETTTGERDIRDVAQEQSGILMSNVAEMGLSRETAKYDFETAKKQMALQGYQLTSGLLQSEQARALETSTGLQNYFQTNRSMQGSVALQNAMMRQTGQQNLYNQRLGLAGAGIGAGAALMRL